MRERKGGGGGGVTFTFVSRPTTYRVEHSSVCLSDGAKKGGGVYRSSGGGDSTDCPSVKSQWQVVHMSL